MPLENLTKLLKDTSASSILSSKSESNAAPHNIRINAAEATEWLEFLNDEKEDSFSFHEWFKNFEGKLSHDQWVFITCDGADTKILAPFFRVLMDIAFNSLIALGIERDRRLWFVFDELAKLKYISALQENITLLRKYGGCVLAATQSINQILSFYGRESGRVMLGQFNTNVVFRIKEVDEARTIAKQVGEVEYLKNQKNTSFGANDIRDGISYTEQEKTQDVIKVNDLASLGEREAYIFLPITEVAITKVKFEISLKPNIIQPSFITKDLQQNKPHYHK